MSRCTLYGTSDLIAYAVRAEQRLTLEYQTRLAIIRRQAIDAGYATDVLFLTETSFDPVTRFNAQLMHGSRHPVSDVDAVAKDVVRRMVGTATVGDLVASIDRAGAGFRAVVRLILSGALATIRHERIASPTLLLKKGTV